VTYNKDAHERDPQDLSWVDTSLKTSVERISVHLDAIFLANLLVRKCHKNLLSNKVKCYPLDRKLIIDVFQ